MILSNTIVVVPTSRATCNTITWPIIAILISVAIVGLNECSIWWYIECACIEQSIDTEENYCTVLIFQHYRYTFIFFSSSFTYRSFFFRRDSPSWLKYSHQKSTTSTFIRRWTILLDHFLRNFRRFCMEFFWYCFFCFCWRWRLFWRTWSLILFTCLILFTLFIKFLFCLTHCPQVILTSRSIISSKAKTTILKTHSFNIAIVDAVWSHLANYLWVSTGDCSIIVCQT